MSVQRWIRKRTGDHLPQPPACELCGSERNWFNVTGPSRLLPGSTAVEIVALCATESCDGGPTLTASRMGWGLE